MTDGDAAFLRVNDRDPAHTLEPGTVAAATNCRLENGQPRPRYGVALDDWGRCVPLTNLLAGQSWTVQATANSYYRLTGLTVGHTYRVQIVTATTISQGRFTLLGEFGPLLILATYAGPGLYEFVATSDALYLWAPHTTTGSIAETWVDPSERPDVATCAYKRFSDPGTDTDQTILITDEWRTDEDGGRGRAWRILPGNAPQEIPLNGHDVWDTARLVQCDNAMMLLRQGNERHYFIAADVADPLNDRITLHCEPSWAIGTARRVKFDLADPDSAIYGAALSITNTSAAADTISVTTTGLVNGDAMLVTGITGITAGTVKYLRVVSSGVVSLYDTKDHAVTGGGTGLFNVTVNGETGTLSERVPSAGNYYYASHVSSGIIELYQDSQLTIKLLYSTLTAPIGKFYIELATDPLPFFGNGAPVLIMQPDGQGLTACEHGFKAVAINVAINGTNATTDVMTARNHRFVPGDSVTGTAITGVTWPAYAAPQSEHTLKLYDTEEHALADNGTGVMDLAVDAETGTIWKTNASQLAIPPLREGIYYKGRLLGFNGFSNIVISDPGDFLHFEQFRGTVPANFGEAGRGICLLELGADALLIVKQHSVFVITGLSGDSSAWYVEDITKEFGGLSALAALNVGTDGWLWTRKGVASVIRTVSGDKQATVDTVSDDLAGSLREVDWSRAGSACAEIWNGRYFLAVPLRGQEEPVNNAVFVFNFKNQYLHLDQTDAGGEIVGRIRKGQRVDSWEGKWTGDLLTPAAFAKLTVNGEERLTFVTPDGLVCWLHDGWDDAGAAIETELLTRGYFGGREMLTLRGDLTWDSFQPRISASIVTRGVNEEEALAGFTALEYDRTKYLTSGQADYDPSTSTTTQFNAPDRQDYSPADGELAATTLDVHQNLNEPFRCRVRGSAPQLRITNDQGSLRVCSVTLQAKPVAISATRKT